MAMPTKFSTVESYHGDLLKDLFPPPVDLNDDDALLLISILHVCDIELRGPILRRSNATRVTGLTQRDAAEAVAHLWSGTKDPRRMYTYWYVKWNTDWNGYRHLEALSPEELFKLRQLKAKIESHRTVKAVVPEDPEMFGGQSPVR